MNRRLLQYGMGLAMCVVLSGCATDPAIGSKIWHEDRIGEIETAHNQDELTKEEYLSLKNEADQTRVEYQNAARERLQRKPNYLYYPHSIHRFHHHH